MFRKVLGIFLLCALVFLGYSVWKQYQAVGWTLSADAGDLFSNIVYGGVLFIVLGIAMAVVGFYIAKLFGFDTTRWARISFFSGELSLWAVVLAGKARDNPEEMKKLDEEMKDVGKLIYWTQLLLLIVLIIAFFVLLFIFPPAR